MTKIFHTIESCVAAIALRSTRLRLTARNGLSAAAFALITLVAGAGASFSPTAQAIPVDINGTAMSGLWNIDAESGWGASVVHQYNIMFITIYTFDANRNPIWYAATRCVVAGDRCADTGMIRIANGDAVTSAWSGNRTVAGVGSLEMIFDTINTARMNFVIDGRSGSKAVTRSQFANPPVVAPPPTTGGLPFVFDETRITELTFSEETIGSTKICNARITATNIGNTPNSIFLQYDIVVNNIVTGSTTFTGSSVRPGFAFQSTMGIVSNGGFIPCNQFTLLFNPAGSRVFKNQ